MMIYDKCLKNCGQWYCLQWPCTKGFKIKLQRFRLKSDCVKSEWFL